MSSLNSVEPLLQRLSEGAYPGERGCTIQIRCEGEENI
jgi:hypothetical protein